MTANKVRSPAKCIVPKSPSVQSCSFQGDKFSIRTSIQLVSCFCTTQAKPLYPGLSSTELTSLLALPLRSLPCYRQLQLCWRHPTKASHQHGISPIPSLAAERGHTARCPTLLNDKQLSSILQCNEGSEVNEKSSKGM